MANIEDLYKKSDFNKLPLKKDRTPITEADFDLKKLSVSETKLENARGGKLNLKKYSDTVKK
jgi:hypothetical protein